MTNKLKPCPFCGSRNLYIPPTRGYMETAVECLSCEVIGPGGRINDEQSAIDAWNNRVTIPPQTAAQTDPTD